MCGDNAITGTFTRSTVVCADTMLNIDDFECRQRPVLHPIDGTVDEQLFEVLIEFDNPDALREHGRASASTFVSTSFQKLMCTWTRMVHVTCRVWAK